MRKVPVGLIIVVIVAAGLAVGGLRSWRLTHSGQPLAGSGAGIAQIELLTTQDKDNWVRSQVWLFNDDNFKQYQVISRFADSRAAMESLIAGKDRPVLWSPDSPMWIDRANDVWPGGAGKLVNTNDPDEFRVFLRTPVVILTTQEKAAFLRPILAGPHPWASIHDLATGAKKAPWGHLTYRHADPLTSNSGALTLGLILAEYCRDKAPGQSMTAAALSPAFGAYLAETEQALSYTPACAAGSAAVARDYAANPASCDFIVTYENLALSVAQDHPDLVAIYPSPTMVAQQSLCLLDGDWVSPAQRAGAEAFLTFVARPKALQDGLKYNMRPAIDAGEETLDTKLVRYGSRGFEQLFTEESAPPYDALNAAAAQWNTRVHREVRPAPIDGAR